MDLKDYTGEVVLTTDEPNIETMYVECKFTVESEKLNGGDWEKNIGGSKNNRRVTFEGYATNELYKAVMDAVRTTVDA